MIPKSSPGKFPNTVGTRAGNHPMDTVASTLDCMPRRYTSPKNSHLHCIAERPLSNRRMCMTESLRGYKSAAENRSRKCPSRKENHQRILDARGPGTLDWSRPASSRGYRPWLQTMATATLRQLRQTTILSYDLRVSRECTTHRSLRSAVLVPSVASNDGNPWVE